MQNKQTVFQVTGIHCPKCVKALHSHMLKNKGIEKICVSEDYHTVSLIYNPELVSAEDLITGIQSTPNKDFRIIISGT